MKDKLTEKICSRKIQSSRVEIQTADLPRRGVALQTTQPPRPPGLSFNNQLKITVELGCELKVPQLNAEACEQSKKST